MKKVFKLAAIAVLALGLTTACKQKTTEPEEILDTTPIEQVVDTLIDEVTEEVPEEVVAEPVKKAAKPVAKKTTDPTAKTVKKGDAPEAVGTPGTDIRQDKKSAERKATIESMRVTKNDSKN